MKQFRTMETKALACVASSYWMVSDICVYSISELIEGVFNGLSPGLDLGFADSQAHHFIAPPPQSVVLKNLNIHLLLF